MLNTILLNDEDKNKKYKQGIILIHFPKDNNFGCQFKCSFCTANELNFNKYVYPELSDVEEFIQTFVEDDGYVQICGIGETLFEFDINKQKIVDLINLIIKNHRKVSLVTKDITMVEKYLDSYFKDVDTFMFSIENKVVKYKDIIDKIIDKGKRVKISKIYNFTNSFDDIPYSSYKDFAAFYSKNHENSRNLKILFRSNFKYVIDDKQINDELINNFIPKIRTINDIEIKNIRLGTLGFKIPQLWNKKVSFCKDMQYLLYNLSIIYDEKEI